MQRNQNTAASICHIAHIWMAFGINRDFWEIRTQDLPFCSWSQKQNSHLLTHPLLYPWPRKKGCGSHFLLWAWPHSLHPLLYFGPGQVLCLWLQESRPGGSDLSGTLWSLGAPLSCWPSSLLKQYGAQSCSLWKEPKSPQATDWHLIPVLLPA